MNRRKLAAKVLPAFFVYLILAFFLAPLYWLVTTSVKPAKDYHAYPPVMIPNHVTADSYRVALGLVPSEWGENLGILPFLGNSLIVAFSATALSIVIGFVAAYAFNRYQFPLKRVLFFSVLGLRMIPSIVIVVPMFLVLGALGLIDTRAALVIAYTSFLLPFTIWMLEGFINNIPREMDEAAVVDGCSLIQTLARVIFPLAAPGVAATAIFALILCWNEFMFALVLTNVHARTIPLGITGFLSERGILWGEMFAAIVITAGPLVLFAGVVQRHMVRGIGTGATKG